MFCPAQALGRISHFFTTLEVEYMSEKTIETLMQKLNLMTIEDFYNLKYDDMISLSGFGKKKISKIITEIEKTKTCKSENLLAAFGIVGIGKTNSKIILKKYDFEDLFSINDLSDLDGIGEITSNNFVAGMKQNKYLYAFLKENGLTFIENNDSNTLKDMIFTLTGTGNLKRNEYKKMIESQGAIVKGISSKTNYLVTNDVDSNSSKTKKAKKMGIEIISYVKLLKKIDLE